MRNIFKLRAHTRVLKRKQFLCQHPQNVRKSKYFACGIPKKKSTFQFHKIAKSNFALFNSLTA